MSAMLTIPIGDLRTNCGLCGGDHAVGARVVLASRSENGLRVASCASHFEADESRRASMGLAPRKRVARFHRANLREVIA